MYICQGSKCYIVWRQREGGGFSSGFSTFFCLIEKHRDIFFTWKESAWQISADSEQLEKLRRNPYIHLTCMEPFDFLILILLSILGHVSWVGKSAMEVTLKMSQVCCLPIVLDVHVGQLTVIPHGTLVENLAKETMQVYCSVLPHHMASHHWLDIPINIPIFQNICGVDEKFSFCDFFVHIL